MTQLLWDQTGEREYQTGVDKGVLFIPDNTGDYTEGYAWNGLTTVVEAPTGAAVTKKFADNISYASLVSAEEFAGTIDAYTYPNAFAQCDGSATPTPGVSVGQQRRHMFGLTYRTRLGNDVLGSDFGYKLHLVWGALAEPSQKSYASINDAPDAIAFSWKFSTTPVAIPGLKASAIITIDSTQVDAAALATLEETLYGTVGVDAHLPSPADVMAMFSGTVTVVTPDAPTLSGRVITIPAVTGVVYKINGVVKAAGALPPIAVDTVVTAEPTTGYKFPLVTDDDWFFKYV